MPTIGVFAYDFAHKKTQDFLTQLYLNGISVAVVVAAPFESLGLPAPVPRVNPRHLETVSTRAICGRFGWPYYVVKHNHPDCAELLNAHGVNLGVISGARILKEPVLSTPGLGILNFHPGMLPEVRGLDTVQWSIVHNKPMGVTVHFIDESIDRGHIVVREEIPLYADDSLSDISLRLHETQVRLLVPALRLAAEHPRERWPRAEKGTLYRHMPPEIGQLVPGLLQKRLQALTERRVPVASDPGAQETPGRERLALSSISRR